jgi:hypothetical protein
MKKYTAGFSLVEILIGVSIASVVSILLISLISNNTSLVSDQNSKVNQGLEINNAKPIIDETLKSGSSIVAQYPLTGTPTYSTGSEAVVLSVPSVNATEMVIANTFDYLVIYKDPQSPKILRKKVLVDPLSSRKEEDRVLLTKLSLLQFNYMNTAGTPVSPTLSTKIGYIINISDFLATEEKISSISGSINLRNN